MKIIEISDIIKEKAPLFKGIAISADIINSESSLVLWEEFNSLIKEFTENNKVEDINKRITIKATREAYKALGKEPNRYRPSAEALCRRILKEKSLYKINTLVDLINLVSIKTGFSIGGFDENKIEGEKLTLERGKSDDQFMGIGRGTLNIEGLPVYKDKIGGIGTPTSDEERTKISVDTTKTLIIVNGYSGCEELNFAKDLMIYLLIKYTEAKNIDITEF